MTKFIKTCYNNGMKTHYLQSLWGRPGFDVDCETGGACRGCSFPRKKMLLFKLVANDNSYAEGVIAA